MSTHEHTHEHGGSGVYVKTLLALLILTILTVAASYIDFGSGNVVIALLIASIKASLVALFFMHLRYEKAVNAVIACSGFLFLGIFLMFCFIDFDTRDDAKALDPQPVMYGPAKPAGAAAASAPAAEAK
ncbi:MAG TPA: cytochrome C oxidase subunit IV family protein [Bryobacteraceae bacterium]|jgi:cytochrome c oxidase subunit 4|nr:cytochrome C oxidase subunit IV family protein [Bryobacteraceae bacterium]